MRSPNVCFFENGRQYRPPPIINDMKLTFCGAACTTTGSQHLLEINKQHILLDCGLYQGHRLDTFERNKHFRFSPRELTAVVLSHAHIDHSGNLPNLVKQGFQGNIYSTFATRDLSQLMLADSAHVQAADARYINKKRAKKNQPPIEPLYSADEAETSLRQFVSIGYNRPVPIADGVTLTFLDAGHILGSAQVLLDIRDQETGRRTRFLFSGDIGRGNNSILRDPEYAEDVDILLMESTYGGIEHGNVEEVNGILCSTINRALEKKGKILIPSFAVERTQQLIYALQQITQSGQIPQLPIYVDSPLAVNATEVFRLHPECFNESIYRYMREKHDPFGFEKLTMVRESSQSKTLNDLTEPAIIIAASGMCEAGRIQHHLANNISNPDTTVFFVGYCAANTLGWKILKGDKVVNIYGEPHEVKAHIVSLDHFSGHADHRELMEYYRKTKGVKKKVWLVHGERPRSEALLNELTSLYPTSNFAIAEDSKSVSF